MEDFKSASSYSGQRTHSVGQEPVTSVLAGDDVPVDDSDSVWDSDDEVLAALGYKPEFKREFTLWTTFCVSFAVLGLLPSFGSTLYYGMGLAGTAAMTWGWIVAMIGVQSVAMSMAELCSSMPTSGGLYYAAAVLAPPGWGPLAAWVTGWSNWISQVTGAPSVNYGTAAMILASASIQNPDYTPTAYQTFLLTTFLIILHACLASLPTRWIARNNSVGSTFNMVALVIVIILIPAACDRTAAGLSKFNASSSVWGDVYPGVEFPSGVGVIMSFAAVIWTMSGYDAPFHLAEECSNANMASPRAIVMTSSIGGIFGWFLQLVVAYTVADIYSVMNSELGQPFAAYCSQVLPQPVALTILSLTIIAGFAMGQGCFVAASRVTFAYARDGCFPFSRFWSHVNTYTRTPVNAVLLNALVGCVLVLLIFGGTVSINAIFSVGALASSFSFATPIFIRVFFVGRRFRRGPWHLGMWSMPSGILSCAFVLMMIPFLCLPAYVGEDLTPDLMNWTVLVWGGPMLVVLVWWVVDARKWFHGPKVNLEHLMHGREEQAAVLQEPIEGKYADERDVPVHVLAPKM